jgi:uncharacterized damage-inducible protein DinB
MISPAYAQMMARYNRWQNHSLYTAADGLTDAERRKDRGAFFKSIHATLNHILWADAMWMSRVSDAPKPTVGISDSDAYCDNWEMLKQERIALDERLIAWADRLDEAWLSADLCWRPATRQTDMARPRWRVVAHIFNHQTHHRGQVHAMLTAAGARPEATDLIMMEAAPQDRPA